MGRAAAEGAARLHQRWGAPRGAAAARRKLTVEHFNGRDVLATPLADLLQKEGFARLPDGMRWYASPF